MEFFDGVKNALMFYAVVAIVVMTVLRVAGYI